ncbi:restriction endonuclease subunit S [Pseudomonas aeruginosa]
MSKKHWRELPIGKCLSESFAGEWGTEPNPANARVLRATDINNEGQINLSGGAPRRIPAKKLADKRLQAGDILLEGSGGSPEQPVGRVAFFPGVEGKCDFLCSNFFKTLRPDPFTANPRFLFWKLMWFYKQPRLLTLQQQTTGLINLKFDEYKESTVSVPEDISEQGKVAEVIDTLDTAIHQTEAIVEKLKQVKQGLLHDLLTRGVDANGKLRPSYEAAPDLYQKTVIGWRPKDWEICQVSSVLSGIDAGKSPDCQDIPAKGDEWGVLKVGAVHPDGLKLNENKVVEEARLKNPAYLVRNGDLLLSRANTFELVGLVCYVTNHPERLMLSDKTLRLSVKANRMTTTFLFWQLQHPKTRTQIEIAATGTSGSMKNISQGGVEKLWISRPLIDEQEEITKRLVAASDRCRDEQEKLSKMREMKSGLMDDLLTGRVRVTPLLAQ